ncbi:methyl-accepting chemotaxis protein [Desulfocurvibacter africanus]|uniref:methyl-accepting chemotaxis protein n=1 Tax=Desulfocurvibacter africanus TaxID=873 RepID=UPI00040C4CF0|nr:methyl-accepting chemotaxis protein [Desulfocurvibacter africanus]
MSVRNLKIGMKLGLGFGAILLIILLCTLALMPFLGKADQESMAVADHYLDYAFQADNLEKTLLRMQLTFSTASTAHDHEGVYQKRLDEQRKQFLKNINEFKDMFRRMGNMEFVRKSQEIEDSFLRFFDLGTDMVKVFQSQGMEEGHKVGARLETLARELEAKVVELRSRQTEVVKGKSADVVSAIDTVRLVLIVSGGIALALAVLTAFLLNRLIAKPIDQIAATARGIAAGDMSLRIKADTRDEVGELGAAFNVLLDKVDTMLALNRAVLDSIPDPLHLVDRDMKIVLANEATARSFKLSPQEVLGKDCADVLGSSSCSTDACPVRRLMRGETASDGQLIECVQAGRKRVLKPFVDIVRDKLGREIGFLELARDMTDVVTKEQEIEASLANLQRINSEIGQASARIAQTSEEISAQVEQVNAGAEHQKGRMAETATAMEEMNASIFEVARNAIQAAEQAEVARRKAQAGSAIVKDSVQAINAVSRLADILKGDISALGTQAGDIGRIIDVISDIADQTNLLALNAAIEAARAGEAGRGFAVVADEVRKLAEKTMHATKEVVQAIQAIQAGVERNIGSMEESAKAVEHAAELAKRSGEALDEIVPLVDATTDQIRSIATASEEQSKASEEINRHVSEVNRISSETAEGMTHAHSAVGDLAALAQQLRDVASDGNG